MSDTFITDQDRNFSVNTGYAPSDANRYARASANLMALPSQMTLLDVQQRQGALLGQDMHRRKAIFDEDERVQDQREFDQFADEMRAIPPGDIQGNAAMYSDLSRKYIGNKDVKEWLDFAGQEDLRSSNARKNSFEDVKMNDEIDSYEKNFEASKQVRDLSTKSALNQAKLINEQSVRALENVDQVDVDSFGRMIGSFNRSDGEMGTKASQFWIAARDTNLDKSTIRKVQNLMGGYGKSMMLEEAEGSGLDVHYGVLAEKNLRNAAGVGIADMPEGERNAILDTLDEKSRSRVINAIKLTKPFEASRDLRDGLRTSLLAIVDNLPDKNDPKAVSEWESRIMNATIAAGTLTGQVDDSLAQKARVQKDHENALKIQKEISGIKARMHGMSNADKRLKIAQSAVEMRQKNMDQDEIFRILSIYSKTDGFDADSPEEMMQQYDEFEALVAKGNEGKDHYAE